MGVPYYFRTILRNHPECLKLVVELETVDILALDFNCAIHQYNSGLSNEERIQSVCDGLRKILSLFRKSSPKTVYVAIDGVVPKAKQIQQKQRRLVASLEKRVSEFDKNQISPCTPFMKSLESELLSQFPWVKFSSSAEPGEGEHKIIQYIRKRSPKTAIVYGLDADLIQLCLGLENTDVSLLREYSEFGNKEVGWGLLKLGHLKKVLPVQLDFYETICPVFGNDFLPGLAMFLLRQNGYTRAMEYRKKTILEFLQTAAKDEEKVLQTIERNRRTFVPWTEGIPVDLLQLEKSIRFAEPAWRSRYYLTLFQTDSESDIRRICQAYWKTYWWVRKYYTENTPVSWSWFYPYSDAPLVSDLVKYYSEVGTAVDSVVPDVRTQLQFILPIESQKTAGVWSGEESTYKIQKLGYGGFLFRTFLWECHPILTH